MNPLLVNNTMVLPITGLTDQDGNTVTGATVEVTIYDTDGAEVSGGPGWPVTASDDGGGDYSAELSSGLDLVHGQSYDVEVVATFSGQQSYWTRRTYALDRTF